MRRLRNLLAVSLALLAVGCKKNVAPRTVPPPSSARAEAPEPVSVSRPPRIVELTVEPWTIERGQAARLRWCVIEATEVLISPGIGTVANSAARQISPRETTTFTLTAKGPGGVASKSLMLRVIVAPPPPSKGRPSESLASATTDVYFDFDVSDIRDDASATLIDNASVLMQLFNEFPSALVLIEGHCDE